MKPSRKTVGLSTCVAIVMALSLTCSARSEETPDFGAAIDTIFQEWNKQESPGCAVGIQRADTPFLIRTYGSADLEHGVPIDAATVFEAGSIAKQFTAASVLMLVEQKKLSLIDDVRKFIPELPDYGTAITIGELLGHTSGLRDWGIVEAMAGWPRTTRFYTLGDVLSIAARQKALNYRPGTVYSYTNTGFNLLAIIVERVGKVTLAQFSHEHLFVPLGMVHTQWRDDYRRVVKNRAVAYDIGEKGIEQDMPFENAYGNGGLLTTVSDLLRWNEALTAGELGSFVTTELQRQATLADGRPIAYARGLFVRNDRGVREFSHPGVTAGYRAWLGRYPDQRLSIAILCNANNVHLESLHNVVADLFLPKIPVPTAIPLTADQVARREGLFVDARMGLPMRLKAHDKMLVLLDGKPLVAVSPDEFRTNNFSLHFNGDDRFVLDGGDGDPVEYQRRQPWRPDRPQLLSFSGRYTSDEALASFRIALDGDQLVLTPADRPGAALVLTPLYADTFEMKELEGVIHFNRDSNGKITGFEMSAARVRALGAVRMIDDLQSHQ